MKRGTIRSKPQVVSIDPKVAVDLTVNGLPVSAQVSARMLLSDFLRHELGLTGTHVGCEHGVCGACTVIVDGVSARSCLAFVVQIAGADVRTIESVAGDDGSLHPLQEAFRNCHALQCGYCTPGMIMNILSNLESGAPMDLSEEGIRETLSGNLCRCTGYQNIVAAVRQAANALTRR